MLRGKAVCMSKARKELTGSCTFAKVLCKFYIVNCLQRKPKSANIFANSSVQKAAYMSAISMDALFFVQNLLLSAFLACAEMGPINLLAKLRSCSADFAPLVYRGLKSSELRGSGPKTNDQ